MDKIELFVNGETLIFTSKSVTYAGHEFFYSKMSNITHRDGSKPAYLFNYEGKRIELPDDPKNKKITLKIFQQVVAMEKKRTEAISPYLPEKEPVTPVDELQAFNAITKAHIPLLSDNFVSLLVTKTYRLYL